jgi:hypothetical protein
MNTLFDFPARNGLMLDIPRYPLLTRAWLIPTTPISLGKLETQILYSLKIPLYGILFVFTPFVTLTITSTFLPHHPFPTTTVKIKTST